MGGGNDAGAVQVHAQLGQDYGMKLLWTLILLSAIVTVAGGTLTQCLYAFVVCTAGGLAAGACSPSAAT